MTGRPEQIGQSVKRAMGARVAPAILDPSHPSHCDIEGLVLRSFSLRSLLPSLGCVLRIHSLFFFVSPSSVSFVALACACATLEGSALQQRVAPPAAPKGF
jgi:hypothetical protein